MIFLTTKTQKKNEKKKSESDLLGQTKFFSG